MLGSAWTDSASPWYVRNPLWPYDYTSNSVASAASTDRTCYVYDRSDIQHIAVKCFGPVKPGGYPTVYSDAWYDMLNVREIDNAY